MTRPAALCVALLALAPALAGCDSGAPDDDLVGTWTFASITNRQLATVSRTQAVVDLTQPGSGAFALGGDEDGSLAHVWGFYRYGTFSQLSVGSYDPGTESPPAVRRSLDVSGDAGAGTWNVWVHRQSDTEFRSYFREGAGPVRSGTTYSLDTDATSVYPEGAKVRVSGSLTLGSRTLTAGQPVALSEYAHSFSPAQTTRYRFEAGGTLRVIEVSGNRTVERAGTWARSGDDVTLSTTTDGVTTTYVYRVGWAGGALLLSSDPSGYPCDASCRGSAEDQYGIEPGTLASLRTEETLRLTAAPAHVAVRAADAPESPAPGPPLPAPLHERIAVRPMG